MQCMKFLRLNLQKLTQNFNNISSILKIPKIFQMHQILGFKTWNACKWRRSEAYKWRKAWKKLENPKGRGLEWVREVWEMKSQRHRERDRQKWATDCIRRIYRPLVNFDRWVVEVVSRHLSSKCREKAMLSDHVLRSYRGIKTPEARYDARSIHQVLRCYRDCDKKKLRKLDKWLVIEEVSRRCRASFSKTVFERRKTQIRMQSSMQLN